MEFVSGVPGQEIRSRVGDLGPGNASVDGVSLLNRESERVGEGVPDVSMCLGRSIRSV